MQVELIAQSSKRLRFACPKIPASADTNSLRDAIRARFDVDVKILSKSIVFYGGNLDAASLGEFLSKYELVASKEKSSRPSKAPIYLSSAALASHFLLPAPLATAMTYIACAPVLKDGVKEAAKLTLSSRLLEATAVLASLVLKDNLAANATNTMLAIGEYIEEDTAYRSDDLVKELSKPSISHVWVEKVMGKGKSAKTELVQVEANEVQIGDIVVVGAGELIGVDGYIVEGESSVNQVSMNGEAAAVRKGRGDKVLSGTVVEEGRIKIWAENVGADTATARIKGYIEASLQEKSAIGQQAFKLADKLVPVTVALAAFSALRSRGLAGPASVLQADYSCALKLTTPTTFKAAIAKAGKSGVLLKGSAVLERLAAVDTIIFDKTGTLTHGALKVERVLSFAKDIDEATLLNLTASAEEHYFHPVAEAIVNSAKERGFKHINHDEVEFIVARGVRTRMDGQEVLIGSRRFLETDRGVSFKSHSADVEALLNEGYTLLYVAREGKLLGLIAMRDDVRENAAAVIAGLKKAGIKRTVMLSGDVQSKAESVGRELGLDEVYAQLLPTDKAAIIERLKKEGAKIAFVGDGINDAPSLVQADVGFSMQKGADLAKASSDVSLLKDDLACVLEAKENANHTMRVIERNFKATLWINSAILTGAALGILSPVATGFLHNGTTIALLRKALRHESLI